MPPAPPHLLPHVPPHLPHYPLPTPSTIDAIFLRVNLIGLPKIATYAGLGVGATALLLLLIGFVFGRPWLRGVGVVLWLSVVTIVVTFSIFIMADAARLKPYEWGLAALAVGLCCFVAAGEWSLRRLSAPHKRR